MSNSTVYKFRNWDNNFHRAILIHNKIYVPSVSELNDPFDFQLAIDFSLLNTDEKINQWLDHSMSDYLNTVQPSKTDWLKIETVRNNYKNSIKSDPKTFSQKYLYKVLEFHNKHLGILCLSEVWNNILMWTHYSHNHTGFCIGFNKESIKNSGFFGQGGAVNYCTNYPRINPLKWNENDLETMFIESHTKSYDWHYEKEYRFVKIWHPEIPTFQDRIFEFDDSLVNEVIVGFSISKDNEKEIRDLCCKKNIPIYKIQKSQDEFILERKLL